MKKLFLVMISSMVICGVCNTRYEACFTIDKSNISVGDTITFSNCSDYGNGRMDASWDFGDGGEAYTKSNASVEHVYTAIGQFEVILYIGNFEHGSKQSRTITVE